MGRLVTEGFEEQIPHTGYDAVSWTYNVGGGRNGGVCATLPTNLYGGINLARAPSQLSDLGCAARVYIRFSGLPVATQPILGFPFIGVSLEPTGGILVSPPYGLYTSVSGVTLTAGTWYCVEVGVIYGPYGCWALRIDGNVVTTGRKAAIPGSEIAVTGYWINEPSATIDYDDVALNDLTGSEQNTWPGPGSVRLLPCTGVTGSGWDTGTSFKMHTQVSGPPYIAPPGWCDTGQVVFGNDATADGTHDPRGRNSSLTEAVNNVPPIGELNLQGYAPSSGKNQDWNEVGMISNPTAVYSRNEGLGLPNLAHSCPPGSIAYARQIAVDLTSATYGGGVGDTVSGTPTGPISGAIGVSYGWTRFNKAVMNFSQAGYETGGPTMFDVNYNGITVTKDIDQGGPNLTKVLSYDHGSVGTISVVRQTYQTDGCNMDFLGAMVDCDYIPQGPICVAGMIAAKPASGGTARLKRPTRRAIHHSV